IHDVESRPAQQVRYLRSWPPDGARASELGEDPAQPFRGRSRRHENRSGLHRDRDGGVRIVRRRLPSGARGEVPRIRIAVPERPGMSHRGKARRRMDSCRTQPEREPDIATESVDEPGMPDTALDPDLPDVELCIAQQRAGGIDLSYPVDPCPQLVLDVVLGGEPILAMSRGISMTSIGKSRNETGLLDDGLGDLPTRTTQELVDIQVGDAVRMHESLASGTIPQPKRDARLCAVLLGETGMGGDLAAP